MVSAILIAFGMLLGKALPFPCVFQQPFRVGLYCLSLVFPLLLFKTVPFLAMLQRVARRLPPRLSRTSGCR